MYLKMNKIMIQIDYKDIFAALEQNKLNLFALLETLSTQHMYLRDFPR